jgi:hypothetical protein
MGNDLISYRAAIGSFQPKRKHSALTKKNSSHSNETKKLTLGLLILFMATWKNISYILITCMYIIAMCSDVHSNPGPPYCNDDAPKNIKLCNLNIHSVKKTGRFDQVKEELGPNYDVICMSESWLKPHIPDSDFKLDNFNGPFRLDRPEGKAGGVVVWIRNTIVTKRIKFWEIKGLELIWLQ